MLLGVSQRISWKPEVAVTVTSFYEDISCPSRPPLHRTRLARTSIADPLAPGLSAAPGLTGGLRVPNSRPRPPHPDAAGMFRSRAPAPGSPALPDHAKEVRRRGVILPLRHRHPDSGKARRSWVPRLDPGGGRCLRGALGIERKRPAPSPRRPSAPRSSRPPLDRAPSRPSAAARSPGAALTRGRGVPAAGEAEKQRPQPAEPSRQLHAAPSLGARRAAAASRVSAPLAPAPTSRLRRPGGWRPAQTGTAPRPPAAGNPSRRAPTGRGGAQFPGSAALHLASPPPSPPDSCRGPDRTSSTESRPGSNACGSPAWPALPG